MSPPSDRPIPFTDLVPMLPAAVTHGTGIADRFDPYWSELWSTPFKGTSIAWRSPQMTANLASMGLIPARKGPSPYDNQSALSIMPRRRKWLAALAAINIWQTITAQQLAAITGYTNIAQPRGVPIDSLWKSGFIYRGRLRVGSHTPKSVPEVFQLNQGAHKIDLSFLNYQDWLGVTAGTLSSRGHQFDLHNVLTVELSLRVGEYCPTISMVLGEALADWVRLFDPRTNPSPSRSADAVWLREDGLRIAVETTRKYHPSMIPKLKQLVNLITEDRSGSVAVLFFACPSPKTRTPSSLISSIRNAIASVIAPLHGEVRARVASRIAVASWSDWFPSPGHISPGLFALTAAVPTGPSTDRWRQINLADPTSIPVVKSDIRRIMANTSYLYGLPHWMRPTPNPTPLEHHLLTAAGFPDALLFDPATGTPRWKMPPDSSRPA